ncbi:MAG: HAD family phosphatase [Acidobacteria bacterium]|nr:HAD family phosphatase [Acidobacteriota bacterium]
MTSIRLLAIDIDGTLLNAKFQVSDENLAALRRAHARGVEIALVTGRRHKFALPIAEQLGVPLTLISSNGALTRSLTGETHHRDLLPMEVARQLCHEMQAFTKHMVISFDHDQPGALAIESFAAFTGSIFGWIEKNRAFIECVNPIEKCLTTDPIQAMFCGSFDAMRMLRQSLSASAVVKHLTVLRTEYPMRDLAIIDLMNRSCSKGAAISRWAERLGISQAGVMAIGDNHNDIEMLEFAGVPVIMGNACEELTSRGWHVTSTHDDHGVARAIERFIE